MCVRSVISKILLEMRLLHRNIGQLVMSAAVVDDIAGWLMLSIVSAMATIGLRAGQVAFSVVSLIGVVVVAAVLGRPVARAALRLAGRAADVSGWPPSSCSSCSPRPARMRWAWSRSSVPSCAAS
jgi:Kef-type K+ transport system membrane component KefB